MTYSAAKDVEDILVIPRRWTKRAYQILLKYEAVPRPWHLEGRWGSRTHKIDENYMAFPIVSRRRLEEQASKVPSIQDLLQLDGVEIRTNQPFVPSHRARDPVYFDATIHPERKSSGGVIGKQKLMGEPSTSKSKNDPPLFTYAELFAGIGGFGVALESLGGSCLFCSELEDYCRATYMANFPTPGQHIHGDIYEVKDSAFPVEGTLDLLVAGFPCQPFSNMSDQPGMNCKKGRGLLFLQIVRMLEISKPRAFLLENVPGLRDMTDTFEHILNAFRQAGYHVVSEVCNARGLTATSRKRLFFVGLRNDLDSVQEEIPFEFPFVPDLQLKAEHILDYDELPEAELSVLRLADETMERLVSSRRWRPHSLAWPNRPCDTMTSHYGNAVGRGESQLVPCKAPYHPRRFSIRECARLMGFPNSFQLVDPRPRQGAMAYRKEYFKQFGNAVCPPLIAALAGAVLDRCSLQNGDSIDWLQKGHDTAVVLAHSATRTNKVELPRGCMVI